MTITFTAAEENTFRVWCHQNDPNVPEHFNDTFTRNVELLDEDFDDWF